MPMRFSKSWIRETLADLHAQIDGWIARWQSETINPLLYVAEDKQQDRTNIYRRADNQLIVSMTDTGDTHVFHMGLWEPEMTIAIGEALVILGRGYQKSEADRQDAEMKEMFGV